MSVGEDRVRTKFNPSADSIVDQIKQKSAELIDLCEQLKGQGRAARCAGADLIRGSRYVGRQGCDSLTK